MRHSPIVLLAIIAGLACPASKVLLGQDRVRPILDPDSVFRAQSPETQLPEGTGQARSAIPPQPTTSADNPASPPPAASAFDPQLIACGQIAFENRCIQCHDREKSLQKIKSVAKWRTTVRRMAEKDGAEVAEGEIDSIATYLASLNPNARQAEADQSAAASTGRDGWRETLADAADELTIFGTLSPTWRGGTPDLQNGGFVPDVWAGLAWQSQNSPVSVKATACFSCHSEAGLGSRIELVEAAVRLDLGYLLTGCRATQLRTSVEAGRFIVPFGAFAQQSNPGVYRTVSKPLMYNMGLRVADGRWGDPVLPMPYSDEGLRFDASYEFENFNATFDGYVVNGLQGTQDGIDFDFSRDYVANNQRPSVGTRVTVGSSMLRFGGSFIAGMFSPTGGVGPANSNLYYNIAGADAQFRWKDILRVQCEYALRNSDHVVDLPGQLINVDKTDGMYLEAELLMSRKYRLGLLGRYDWQRRASPIAPPESDLSTGTFSVQRVTWGINHTLPGGSLLMFNHEHWIFPLGYHAADVFGVRWSVSF